ncbi:hypothetical protein CVT24_012999 [Panaeolus cyanescens]|uniref:FAD dependent oxidoreductase domain-containing protein n=1 Tax=Panaeolus cyanescens TaxID=181874 RepID=A0A409VVR6_9AGAR|nr:hypothetical protein CVT24_012999 [Panaeolus cyanescens]
MDFQPVNANLAMFMRSLAVALLLSPVTLAFDNLSSDSNKPRKPNAIHDQTADILAAQRDIGQIPFSLDDTIKGDPHSQNAPYVSLPVNNPTHSFWLDTPNANPLGRVGSTGPLTQDSDVCIIGSGITGVSAAWHLADMLRPGGANPSSSSHAIPRFKVTILEAREFCKYTFIFKLIHSSSPFKGRNGGHLLANPFRSFLTRQIKHGTAEAMKSYQLERYSMLSLVNFARAKGVADDVDLFEGDHVTIFTTSEEEGEARKDYDAAKDAGLLLDSKIRWLNAEELSRAYGVDPKLGYTGVFYSGYNLWPCKLVTEFYKDAELLSDYVDIVLHTKTPVTSITPLRTSPASDSLPGTDSRTRRWALQTPRGTVTCAYVIHGTNAYAAHLLPFLAGQDHDNLSNQKNVSPGAHGIVPTRGQVGAVRSSVGSADLGWHNSWGGSGGWEYWFPRFQDINSPLNGTDNTPAVNGSSPGSRTRNPLIILGGGRQHSGGNLEAGNADDSELNLKVTMALRDYLPHLFPGKFKRLAVEPSERSAVEDPWEMEWTGIMGFTKSGDPFVGPVSYPDSITASPFDGQYIAAGYSGHGMPRAYACAEAVAGMIHARLTGVPWTRPSWLPNWYLNWASSGDA